MEQEIVTLKIVGGLSHKEIGLVLGITASAAQKRYERAISALRSKED
jgi:DNA-directed RNA polymerase specialized sigma24 family protein